jgi:hypothetical protein
MSETTEFFLGTVKFQGSTAQTTTFEVVGSSAVISVNNATHLRFNKRFFSTTFQILAPMTAVDVLAGDIPEKTLVEKELNYYILLRDNISYRKEFAKNIK